MKRNYIYFILPLPKYSTVSLRLNKPLRYVGKTLGRTFIIAILTKVAALYLDYYVYL